MGLTGRVREGNDPAEQRILIKKKSCTWGMRLEGQPKGDAADGRVKLIYESLRGGIADRMELPRGLRSARADQFSLPAREGGGGLGVGAFRRQHRF